MEKRIDIKTLYASEIGKINDKLRDLKAGHFYGFKGNGSEAGFLENKIDALSEAFNDLMLKIEYGQEAEMDFILKP